MKKILIILLALVIIGSFAACTVEKSDADATEATTTAASTTAAAETTAVETTAEPEGYVIAFVCDEYVSVKVYETQDMTGEGSSADGAVSREADTGTPTQTDGQINFVLVFTEGYELDELTITGEYNKLKGSGDTGVENGYRVTKIAGDLTIRVTSRPVGSAEDDSANGFAVTFVPDEFVTAGQTWLQALHSGRQ